jgi:predicted N-acetyltransferase YhbS
MAKVQLREARITDLTAINRVIEAAIGTWDLADRVKRVSLPLYRYQAHDLDFLSMVVATDADGEILGVAAWEPANPTDLPADQAALLLHGIYVAPAQHHRGIGTRLLRSAEQAAVERRFAGILVRAQAGAAAFFSKNGFEKLAVGDHRRDYPHRYWKPLPPA